MMEHYDIDGLVQYGCEELPGTLEVVNPEWRALDKSVKDQRKKLQKNRAELTQIALKNEEESIVAHAEAIQNIQRIESDLEELCAKRKGNPRKVKLSSLPEDMRPNQLAPLGKQFTDTIKMIAYRAETALVALIKKHLNKEAEARAIIRELFVTAADIYPNVQEGTLSIRIHHMSCPMHDKAIASLLHELNEANFLHPDTELRMIFSLT